MPLILSKSDTKEWINPETDTDIINSLMKPFPESEMDACQISKTAGNSRVDRNYPGIKDRVDNMNLF